MTTTVEPDSDPSPETRPEPQSRVGSILKYDVPASLVVFLVAVPLSIGIAVASGAPIMAGLIAAVVGGILAGILGGSPLQVSGPAAGLTVVVAELVNQFGWGVTCAITVLAGAVQVLLGMSRIARSALAISPVVVHAMLAGIGITMRCNRFTFSSAVSPKAPRFRTSWPSPRPSRTASGRRSSSAESWSC